MIKKITIIGSGNVATILGKELFHSGSPINGVWSRNAKNAEQLAISLQTFGTNKIADLPGNSDLYLIAVSDDAIETVAHQLSKEFGYNIFIAHTSGSFSSEILEKYVQNFGAFYCLQTFNKTSNPDFKKIPILVSATSDLYENKLMGLAQNLSDNCQIIEEKQRKRLHLAAVFVNNFVNHMYTISAELLKEYELNFKLLVPLIDQTNKRIIAGDMPFDVQTGPAVRNDMKIIEQHMAMLEDFPEFRKIYDAVTNNLLSFQVKKYD